MQTLVRAGSFLLEPAFGRERRKFRTAEKMQPVTSANRENTLLRYIDDTCVNRPVAE